MTKLISGKVKKVPSSQVSTSRYQFIRLEETEPDLGIPNQNGQVLLSNVDGTRYWGSISANVAADISNTSINIHYDVDTQTFPPTANSVLLWSGNVWIPGNVSAVVPDLSTTSVNVHYDVDYNSNTITNDSLLKWSNNVWINSNVYSILGNVSIDALSDVDTKTVTPALYNTLLWTGTKWEPGTVATSSAENANIANIVLGLVQSSQQSGYANVAGEANVANTLRYGSDLTLGNVNILGTLNIIVGAAGNGKANLHTLEANTFTLPSYDGSNVVARSQGSYSQHIVSTGSGAVWASKFYAGEFPPEFPFYGDTWFDTTEYKVYLWVTDGGGDFWFDFLPPTF